VQEGAQPQPNGAPVVDVAPLIPGSAVASDANARSVAHIRTGLWKLGLVEAVLATNTLDTSTFKGTSACFRSKNSQHSCKKSEFNYDLVINVTESGDYRVIPAGVRVKQGGDLVEVVAFAHGRSITAITAANDLRGPVLPMKTVLELIDADALKSAPEFSAY